MVCRSVLNAVCICGSATLTMVESRMAMKRPRATTIVARHLYAIAVLLVSPNRAVLLSDRFKALGAVGCSWVQLGAVECLANRYRGPAPPGSGRLGRRYVARLSVV